MKCYRCEAELIWGGDHTYEDYGMEGEGMVTNLSCSNCESSVLVYSPDTEKAKEETEKIKVP